MTQDAFNMLYPVNKHQAIREEQYIDTVIKSTKCKHPKSKQMFLPTIDKAICTKCGNEL